MKRLQFLLVFFLFMTMNPGWAMIKLPSILSPGMVLQQQSTVNIWGWATPGEKITITSDWFTDQFSTVTGPSGKWLVRIPTGKAGGPYTLTIKGENTIILPDVLIGEVWVCSGQSNMEFTIKMLGGWKLYATEKKELKKHDYSQIRFCQVKHAMSVVPLDSCDVSWSKANLRSVTDFSATAWFFAQCLYNRLHVPIGLISTNIGGTPAEAWTSRTAMENDPELQYYLTSPNGQSRETGRISVLYNAMIHPLINFSIRGVIWYQGETNIPDADLYGKLFPAMIRNWRADWNQGDFPFYFVQIAPFDYNEPYPAAAYLREAQTKALALPNTGMASTMDIGNTRNIHPKNKPEVGKRLAWWALAKTYGIDKVKFQGPVFLRAEKEGRRFRLFFDHADSLFSRGGPPVCFTLAGHDGKFRSANAIIEGKTVVLSSDSVHDPRYVRYAFTDTDTVNLYNQAGLPAAPFRTDSIRLLVRNVRIAVFTDSIDDQRYLKIECPDTSCRVHYTLDGSDPVAGSPVYHERMLLNGSAKIRVRAFKGSTASALILSTSFRKHLGVDKQLAIKFPYSAEYPGGKSALLDGLTGSDQFFDGHWQGYLGVDFDGVVDLGKLYLPDSISVSMLQDTNSWIFLPVAVQVSGSGDGIRYTPLADFQFQPIKHQKEPFIKTFNWNRQGPRNPLSLVPDDGNSVPGYIRYIRVYAKSKGKCPKGHPGAGQKAWLFVDEITIW